MKKTTIVAFLLSFFCLVNLACNKTEVQKVKRLAESGDASAQYNLASMYYNGEGVPQNYNEAIRWYKKAADQEDAKAQGVLGSMYYEGLGVPQD